jgi:hypothetical protein
MTVSQSVSLGFEPHLGLMTRYLLLFDTNGLVFVGRPFWQEDGSVFCICCWSSPAQSFSCPNLRISWDSWPYFTVLGLRLPFSSPPTTRRVTVEVFDPASTRVSPLWSSFKFKVTLRLTVSQSVSLGVEPQMGLMTRYLLLFDSYGLIFVGRPLWQEDGSVFCICCWSSPA